MAQFLSGRRTNFNVGVSSVTENTTSLQVIGNVGIGTTNAAGRSLYVIGDAEVSGIFTASRIFSSTYGGGTISGTSLVGTSLSISGISTLSTLGVTGLTTTRNLIVTGIATIGTLGVTGLTTTRNLIVTGIATIGTLGVTGLTTTRDLQVTGISTLTSISVGGTTGISQYILTSTGTGLLWQSVTGIGAITGINVVEDFTGGLKYLAMQTGAGTTQTNNISSNQLVYNSTTTNLGIGTTNPTSKLTVQGDGKFTGVVTATTFIGNLTGYASTSGIATYATNAGIATYATNAGIATYATNAGIATNIKGGVGGSIPYQSAVDTTVLLANGSVGNLLQSNGGTSAPSWASPLGLTIGYANTAGIATFATTAGIATFATTAGIATFATTAGIATFATNAGISTFATNAGIATNIKGGAGGSIPYQSAVDTTVLLANGSPGNLLQSNGGTSAPSWASPQGLTIGYANTAGISTFATNAGIATFATTAGIATYATNAGIATFATNAGIATYATNAGIATYAHNAGIATYATNAGIATFATNAGIATYAHNAGISTFATNAGIATFATNAGISTFATNAGIATNIKGGAGGEIPYQSSSDTTSLLANGSVGNLLQSNGGTSAPSWTSPLGLTIGYANTAGIATFATNAGIATFATNAGIATFATNAGIATFATNAGIATFATNAGIATNVIGGIASVTQLNVSSGVSTLGITSATNLTSQQLNVSGISTLGTVKISSGIITSTNPGVTTVTYFGNLTGTASTALFATTAFSLNGFDPSNPLTVRSVATNLLRYPTFVSGTGSTSYVDINTSLFTFIPSNNGYLGIGTTTPTTNLDVIGNGKFTGNVTATTFIGNLTGTATTASSVALDSVGLGTHTYGDYVKSITGTANQITVTSGTGEGSTPTLSIPNEFTIPQDATVTRDLQVNRNLNVNGNITIGGTSATLFTTEIKISDPDIVLGFRTDGSGNDVSNDNTANHGGVALASTEGTPLVDLFIAGIETNPSTYKKIMWFKSGTFAGLGTDAWLFNYAVGIGSTQFPTGTRLAAGSVQFTENDLSVVRNINASGIVTAVSFIGTASTASFATTAFNLNGVTAGNLNVAFATNAGIATFATNAGISTNLKGGVVGNVVYQSAADTTAFLTNGGSGTILQSNGVGNAPTWVSAAPASAITGLTILDEGTIVGGANSISQLNFVGSIVSVASTVGIATITFLDYVSNAGIATFATTAGIATFATNAGIATFATTAGIATFATNAGISTFATTAGIATFATTAGIATFATTAGIATFATTAGIATFATTAGIATNVIGGIASVTSLFVNISGISTLGTVQISSGIVTATTGIVTYYGDGSKLSGVTGTQVVSQPFTSTPVYPILASNSGVSSVGISTTGSTALVFIPSSGNLGIGTTLPTEKLQVQGNISINGTTSYGSTTATTATVSQTSIYSGLSSETYRSVEYTIQATQGTNYHATKILTVHNGTTAYNSEYGTIYNNTLVGAFDVDISGGNIRLLVTPASSSSTNYTVNFVATKI
jgi:trimeric autotransporter adhesin